MHPGEQTIRLLFVEPLRIRRIHLEFAEENQARTQEFVLCWSVADRQSPREIVRQQFSFSPPSTTDEVEDYMVDLSGDEFRGHNTVSHNSPFPVCNKPQPERQAGAFLNVVRKCDPAFPKDK